MIHESELRLGNIVNNEFTTITGILGNNKVMVETKLINGQIGFQGELNTKDLQPVLLTGNLLERMMFLKDVNADYYARIMPDGNTIAIKPGKITYIYLYRGDYEHRNRINQQEDMTVHFLQNIFFALSGTDCLIQVEVQ